jgi:hypothetical protein
MFIFGRRCLRNTLSGTACFRRQYYAASFVTKEGVASLACDLITFISCQS